MQSQPIAVEVGDGCVRLQAGVLLRAGAKSRLDQQRIAPLPRGIDKTSRPLCLLREHRGRPAEIAFPGRRSAGAFRDVAGFFAVRSVEHGGSIALARGVQSDRTAML